MISASGIVVVSSSFNGVCLILNSFCNTIDSSVRTVFDSLNNYCETISLQIWQYLPFVFLQSGSMQDLCLQCMQVQASLRQIDYQCCPQACIILPPFLYIRFICFIKSQLSTSLTEFLENYINIHNTKFISFDPW